MRKVGLDDYFVSGGTVEVLRTLAGKAVHLRHPSLKRTDEQFCGFCGYCGPGEDQWEEPTPLAIVRNLAPFPTHCLPMWLADYVRGVAVSTQTPEDMAAMLGLAVLAAALAKKVAVHIRSDWTVPVNVYVVVVAASGERKSAVFALMVGPLERLERDLTKESKDRRRTQELRHERAKKAAKDARTALLDADDHDPNDVLDKLHDAERAQSDADQAEPEAIPRLLADDITQEALASLLAEQDGRAAVFSAEGGIFEILAGRYSEGRPNIETFLKAHSGDALRVDRKSRGPEHIAEPALTLGLTVQPDVLHGLTHVKGFRGRGLLARIGYSLPPSLVGYRETDPPTMSEGVATAYTDAVLELGRLGVDQDLHSDRPVRLVLELSPDARVGLNTYRELIEQRMRPDGDLPHLADWASKIQGDVVRYAGLLHMAEHGSKVEKRFISSETMDAAIEIADYLTAHALVAFDEMGTDPVRDGARFILRWIKAKGETRFSRRDAHTALKGRFHQVEDIEPALKFLEAHGYVREAEAERKPGAGRPPGPVYEVNPLVLAADDAKEKSVASPD